MKIVREKLKAKTVWNKAKMDERFKDWMVDKEVNQYVRLPSILVSSLWWAHNSSIFQG
jgi:hypothetical protein